MRYLVRWTNKYGNHKHEGIETYQIAKKIEKLEADGATEIKMETMPAPIPVDSKPVKENYDGTCDVYLSASRTTVKRVIWKIGDRYYIKWYDNYVAVERGTYAWYTLENY